MFSCWHSCDYNYRPYAASNTHCILIILYSFTSGLLLIDLLTEEYFPERSSAQLVSTRIFAERRRGSVHVEVWSWWIHFKAVAQPDLHTCVQSKKLRGPHEDLNKLWINILKSLQSSGPQCVPFEPLFLTLCDVIGNQTLSMTLSVPVEWNWPTVNLV